jgi:hypothetical protein
MGRKNTLQKVDNGDYLVPLIQCLINIEQMMEWELVGETEVLGVDLSPMPLCPPQIPHNLTWDEAQVTEQRLLLS